MFDVLIFAAGRGSRMGALTNSIAKPALVYNGETLISQIGSQAAAINGSGEIFINCSYMAFSVVEALRSFSNRERLNFLWEREIMGTAWSLLQVHRRCKRDILAIHGDLVLTYDGLNSFVFEANKESGFSSVAVHQRSIKLARSEIKFDPADRIVFETREMTIAEGDGDISRRNENAWSNSGIYYFRNEHLEEISIECRKFLDVPNSILLDLVDKHLLKAQIFKGERFSIERPEQLRF